MVFMAKFKMANIIFITERLVLELLLVDSTKIHKSPYIFFIAKFV